VVSIERLDYLFQVIKGMKRRKQKKNYWLQWIGGIILVIGIVVVLFIPVAYQWGWRFNIINGISMEPTYHAGGVVITRPVAPEDVSVGDIILFRTEMADRESLVCHRVIDVQSDDEGLLVQTQGDNNEDPDTKLIGPQDILGKEAIYLPMVGEIAGYYKTQIRFLDRGVMAGPLVISVVVLGIIGVEINTFYDWIFNRRVMVRKERWGKRMRR
jgi:signal peptidase I